MTNASFDRLLEALIELPEENERRPIAHAIRLPFRDRRSVNMAIVSELLLRPTQAFPETKSVEAWI